MTQMYPTEIEPYIWLQEDEEEGHAECGCRLAQENGAKLNLCTMHAAAPQLLEVLAVIVGDDPPVVLDFRQLTLAKTLVRRAKGERGN